MKNAKLIALLLGTAMLATACGGGGGGSASVSGPIAPPSAPVTPPSAPVDPVQPVEPTFNAAAAVENLYKASEGRSVLLSILGDEITDVTEFRAAVIELTEGESPLTDSEINDLIDHVLNNDIVIFDTAEALDTAQVVYDGVLNDRLTIGDSQYHASTKAAISASHSRGWTGSNVNVTVIDGFSHGVTHGSTVRRVTDLVAIDSNIVNIDVAVENGGPDLSIAFANDANRTILQNSDVINISIGSIGNSQTVVDETAAVIRGLGVTGLATIAAGNEGASCSAAESCNFVAQAAIDAGVTTIVVGAVDATGEELTGYSNRAGILQNDFIAAPVFISSGTSFAAPLVAGVAALIMDKFDNTDAQATKNIIFDSADDLGAVGTDAIFGRGVLNVGAALSPIGSLR